MKRTLAWAGSLTILGIAVVVGCGSDDDKGTGRNLPNRNVTEDAGEQKPQVDAGETVSCTGRAAVSDTPACDQCAKEKCCDFILQCDEDPDCRAMQECIAPCDQSDLTCILTCQIAHESGAQVLQKVGACSQQQCKSECPEVSIPDGGFDAF